MSILGVKQWRVISGEWSVGRGREKNSGQWLVTSGSLPPSLSAQLLVSD